MSRRDEVLARAAVVASYARSLGEDVAALIDLMIDPSEDPKGKERSECMQNLEIGLHNALVAVQSASEAFEAMTPTELKEGEPEGDDDDEGDVDDGDDEIDEVDDDDS